MPGVVDITSISIGAKEKIANTFGITQLSIPAIEDAVNQLLISTVDFSVNPTFIEELNIIDKYSHIIPSSVIITNAVLKDFNFEPGWYTFPNMPLTFAVTSFIAVETDFEMGFGPAKLSLDFDIQYEIVAGRVINESITDVQYIINYVL